jgi:TonB-dependent receptor
MTSSLLRLTHTFAIAAALLSTAPLASAQQPGATISGSVIDAQGGALPGALIVARDPSTGSARETTTGPDGRFVFANVPPGGPYTLIASLAGFAPLERRDIFARAGEGSTVQFTLSVAAVSESVTVRAGSALARDEKRSAPSIMDVVAADSVGRFPDANAAEALRRVPGVSMEIDQGEGRFVVVRGIDASLNNVTLNGQIVGTPAEFGTRGVSMDSVPADLVSRLEVVKAVRPDMDANAIGASINIATLGAFDLPGGFLFGSLRSGYNNLSGNAPFTASASFGRVLDAAQRWGLVLGASHSRRQFESELFRVAGNWADFNGFSVPQNQAFFLYDIDRRRTGVNAALEFRPSAGHALSLRANYNRFEDTEGRQQTELDLTRGSLSNQTPTSGSFSQGRATREYRDYTQQHLIGAGMLSGNHEVGRSTVDWALGASRGERETPNRVDWEFRSAANAFPNTYDISDEDLVRVTPVDAFYTPAAYPFRRVRFRADLEREDVLSGEVNLKRTVSFGARPGYWKAGGKIVARDKMQDRTNENYNAASQGFTLADFGLSGVGPADFFRGNFRFGPTLDLAGLQQFFRDQPARFAFDAVSTAQNSVEQDFTADERVYAGYGMVGMDFTGWSLMAGVRVETTRADYAARELLFDDGSFTGRTNPAAGSTDYTDVLPGVHVNFFPARALTIRAAWTNTLGRPAYADLAPISQLDEVQESDGSFVGSLSTGNSQLKPYESMNLDLSFEYYLPSGLLSIAPFYKRIDNPIYGRGVISDGVVYNGRTYARFGLSRPENADRGWIGGVEFNYQTEFSRLPVPFDGLGASLNYTWTDSAVTLFGRNDALPFFKQSDHIGNAALLYRRSGIEAQLSLSFQSPSLASVGATAADDGYADWYTPVDAKISFPLPGMLRAFVEGRNLNDAPRVNYQGVSGRRTADEWYSRDVYVGLDWRF